MSDVDLPAHLAQPFSWPVRVYWEDTDAGGVVYHASYVRFLERGRTEWLRRYGIEQIRLRDEQNILFPIRNMQLAFRAPAVLDDELVVETWLTQCRSASLQFQQRILRAGDLLLEASVRAACVSADRFRPRQLPDDLFNATGPSGG
ncbi:MAG TPA: tol-pal system-associated acyl-CoA thioesterase [Xanthomonadaceae bacterium]|mgnify:CR=1 FL=1|nr:tol-pal system-associated acyl-CoA thioesterase [Xanthomonadaceae bacterium]